MEHHIAEMNWKEESVSVTSRLVRNGCFNQGGPHSPAHRLGGPVAAPGACPAVHSGVPLWAQAPQLSQRDPHAVPYEVSCLDLIRGQQQWPWI